MRGAIDGQTGFVPPINVALLPTGEVLTFGGYFRAEYESTDDGNYDQPPYTGVLRPSDEGQPEIFLDSVDWSLPFDYPYFVTETSPEGETWAAYDSLFCSGATLTAAGDVFVAGGTLSVRRLPDPTPVLHVVGLNAAFSFNSNLREFGRVANMTGEIPAWAPLVATPVLGRPLGEPSRRWYPTAVRLFDGRILVTGGSSIWSVPTEALPLPGQDLRNMAVELFDPGSNAWQVVSWHPADARGDDPGSPCLEFAKTPDAAFAGLYPHVFQLPEPVGGYELLFLGDQGRPVLFAPGGCVPWVVQDNPRPGEERGDRRTAASSVLLPIRVADGSLGYRNGSVLVAGGPEGSSYASRVDGYDPIQNTWGIIGDMGVARTHTSAVVLPDARVLIVGGTAPAVDSYHGRAHYVDPLNAFAMSEGGALALDPLNATQAEARGYHTVSLLLPDGRVLHGGGRHGGYLERATIRFYSPPYMFQERPVIDSAPGAVGYGQVFRVYWSGSETMQVVDAAFLGLGSMTHSFDSNQRHVQALVVGAGTDETGRFVDVVAPPSPRWAPPGPYMLFVLDANRVPSVASMVAVN